MILVWRALLVTLFLEVPVVALCYPGRRIRMASVALVANCFTNLLLNLVLPRVPCLSGCWLIVGEVVAVSVEAAAYLAADPQLNWARPIVVAALSNTLSYELGGALARAIWA